MRNNDKNLLYLIVAVLVIASIMFRVLNDFELEQTTLLFVGIPTLITLLLIKYSKTPKSIYGVVFKAITLFLLMSAILFGEGLVCIIFMAPIFYGTAALIVAIISFLKHRNKSKLNAFILMPLFLFYSGLPFMNSVKEVQEVETVVIVEKLYNINQLNVLPNFMKEYPTFFKLGFPKPISISGDGMDVGDSRSIQFKSRTKGLGVLHLMIKEKTDNNIVFKVISDDTHINHWLTWEEISISVNKIDNTKSEIVWTTKFKCDLGPKWYFEPLQRFGVETMNQHLINSYFNN